MPPRHDPKDEDEPGAGQIEVHLDELLLDRGMTLTELSEIVGITIVNLSVLKNARARAIRFSTLARICEALDCQPGDILTWRDPTTEVGRSPERTASVRGT